MNRALLSGHRAAELGVLVVVLAWAANFIVVKVANREIPPIAFAWIRFSFSALLLLVLLRWREGSPAGVLEVWRADPDSVPVPRPMAKPFFCGPEVWGEGVWDPPSR